jgi:hypothetical protein
MFLAYLPETPVRSEIVFSTWATSSVADDRTGRPSKCEASLKFATLTVLWDRDEKLKFMEEHGMDVLFVGCQ